MQSEQTISYQIGDSLYLSITDRCTLECAFCPKTKGNTEVHEYDLKIHQRAEVDEIISTIDDVNKYKEIVFCGYGEPTLRLKTLLAVSKWIKEQGGRVRVNTDGLANLFHKKNILPQLTGLVDALSVSMNAQNSQTYDLHCQPQLVGSYSAMLDFLKLAPLYVSDVTATAIEGLAGVDIEQCEATASKFGVKFRRRKLDIVG